MRDYEIVEAKDLPEEVLLEWVPEHRLIADLMWAGPRTWGKIKPRRAIHRCQIMLNTYAGRMGAKIETLTNGGIVYVHYLGTCDKFRSDKALNKIRERKGAGSGLVSQETEVRGN